MAWFDFATVQYCIVLQYSSLVAAFCWLHVLCTAKGCSCLIFLQAYCPSCILISTCRPICFLELNGVAGKRFALGMCSLDGHQLAGEERFAVELHADGSVW
jgi:hypothetical protein